MHKVSITAVAVSPGHADITGAFTVDEGTVQRIYVRYRFIDETPKTVARVQDDAGDVQLAEFKVGSTTVPHGLTERDDKVAVTDDSEPGSALAGVHPVTVINDQAFNLPDVKFDPSLVGHRVSYRIVATLRSSDNATLPTAGTWHTAIHVPRPGVYELQPVLYWTGFPEIVEGAVSRHAIP